MRRTRRQKRAERELFVRNVIVVLSLAALLILGVFVIVAPPLPLDLPLLSRANEEPEPPASPQVTTPHVTYRQVTEDPPALPKINPSPELRPAPERSVNSTSLLGQLSEREQFLRSLGLNFPTEDYSTVGSILAGNKELAERDISAVMTVLRKLRSYGLVEATPFMSLLRSYPVPASRIQEMRARERRIFNAYLAEPHHAASYHSRYYLANSIRPIVERRGGPMAKSLWDDITKRGRPFGMRDVPGLSDILVDSDSIDYDPSKLAYPLQGLQARLKQGGGITWLDVARMYNMEDLIGMTFGNYFIEHAKISLLHLEMKPHLPEEWGKYDFLYASADVLFHGPDATGDNGLVFHDDSMSERAGLRRIVLYDRTCSPSDFIAVLRSNKEMLSRIQVQCNYLARGEAPPPELLGVPFEFVMERAVNLHFPEPDELVSASLKQFKKEAKKEMPDIEVGMNFREPKPAKELPANELEGLDIFSYKRSCLEEEYRNKRTRSKPFADRTEAYVKRERRQSISDRTPRTRDEYLAPHIPEGVQLLTLEDISRHARVFPPSKPPQHIIAALNNSATRHQELCQLANHYADMAIHQPVVITTDEARKKISQYFAEIVRIQKRLGQEVYPTMPTAKFNWFKRDFKRREFESLYGALFEDLRVDERGTVYSTKLTVKKGLFSLPPLSSSDAERFVCFETLFQHAPKYRNAHIHFKEPWEKTDLERALQRNAELLHLAITELMTPTNRGGKKASVLRDINRIVRDQIGCFRAARKFESAQTKYRLGNPLSWSGVPEPYAEVKSTLEKALGSPVEHILCDDTGNLYAAEPLTKYESLMPFLESGLGSLPIGQN